MLTNRFNQTNAYHAWTKVLSKLQTDKNQMYLHLESPLTPEKRAISYFIIIPNIN